MQHIRQEVGGKRTCFDAYQRARVAWCGYASAYLGCIDGASQPLRLANRRLPSRGPAATEPMSAPKVSWGPSPAHVLALAIVDTLSSVGIMIRCRISSLLLVRAA